MRHTHPLRYQSPLSRLSLIHPLFLPTHPSHPSFLPQALPFICLSSADFPTSISQLHLFLSQPCAFASFPVSLSPSAVPTALPVSLPVSLLLTLSPPSLLHSPLSDPPYPRPHRSLHLICHSLLTFTFILSFPLLDVCLYIHLPLSVLYLTFASSTAYHTSSFLCPLMNSSFSVTAPFICPLILHSHQP